MSQATTVNIVDVQGVSFSRGVLPVFKDLSVSFPRGKVSAVMGFSGIGKTTLLRLISGQISPDSGEILFDGENVQNMSRSRLYVIRKRMGMLFQSDALFSDMNIFDNVAYPLREHLALPKQLLKSTVMMKLEAVGLRGAASLMPSELSGGMTRRAALVRAIALEPDLVMFDEPFVGQDPISTKILARLISELNGALGMTCIVVSHNVSEMLSISDYVYIMANQGIIAHGSIETIKKNQSPIVRQFLYGIKDDSTSFRCASNNDCDDLNYRDDLLG